MARGTREDGQWVSAEAAAYPARMNNFLADAIINWLKQIPDTNTRFAPAIVQWRKVTSRGHVQPEGDNIIRTQDKLHTMTQVHVWTQSNIPHNHHDEPEKTRSSGKNNPLPTDWYGGHVIDVDFLRGLRHDSRGAVNLGDWAWHFGRTDRSRPPVNIANGDVYHICQAIVSYSFAPVRTFDQHHTHTQDGREHTSWVHLLHPGGETVGGDTEYVISQIIDSAEIKGETHYRTRWYGYCDLMDTWEPIRNISGSKAYERFCADSRRPHLVLESNEDSNRSNESNLFNSLPIGQSHQIYPNTICEPCEEMGSDTADVHENQFNPVQRLFFNTQKFTPLNNHPPKVLTL